MLDDTARFKGNALIDKKDLEGFIGGNTTDKENYLSNFIIDEYFQLLVTEASAQGLKVEAIGWDTFWKVVGHRPANNILKEKAPLLEQDIVLVPLNPGLIKHWSLLVVKPKEKKMFVLNSLAASFVKPSTKNAISKMWDLLQEIDPKLDPEEWHFSRNTPQDILQQSNSSDCGAFVCAYTTCLLLKSSLPGDFTSFRKHVVLELHSRKFKALTSYLRRKRENTMQLNTRSRCFTLAVPCKHLMNPARAEYKFLHQCSAQLFDWPKRDDIDTCHDSCVFYGLVSVVGNAPSISMAPEVQENEKMKLW